MKLILLCIILTLSVCTAESLASKLSEKRKLYGFDDFGFSSDYDTGSDWYDNYYGDSSYDQNMVNSGSNSFYNDDNPSSHKTTITSGSGSFSSGGSGSFSSGGSGSFSDDGSFLQPINDPTDVEEINDGQTDEPETMMGGSGGGSISFGADGGAENTDTGEVDMEAHFSDNPDGSRNDAEDILLIEDESMNRDCLLYTSPSPRDRQKSRMPSSA